MNVHAPALAEAHRLDDTDLGICRRCDRRPRRKFPKKLSPKYFYDATGSELFEQITVLPEYYPTRTELCDPARARRRDRQAHPARRGAGRVRRRRHHQSAPAARALRVSRPTFRSISPAISSRPRPSGLRSDFPDARGLSGRRRFHRAVCAARCRRRHAEGRLLSGLDARQFRAARGAAPSCAARAKSLGTARR